MTGSLAHHDELARAYENMLSAIYGGANAIARQAARTTLLLAAERCGFAGQYDVLIWAAVVIGTRQGLETCSSRTLDEAVRSMPKAELAAILGVGR